MDFKMWLLVATAVLATSYADPMIIKEPQEQAQSTPKPKTAQKRQDNYQDMIVYLTPTQIKDIESGKAVFEPHYTYIEPSQNQYKQQEQIQSKYQPEQQFNQQEQSQSKYQPEQQFNQQELTQSKYQPEQQYNQQEQTQSKYQPEQEFNQQKQSQSKYQPEQQFNQQELTQSKYQPEQQYNLQEQSQSKYQPEQQFNQQKQSQSKNQLQQPLKQNEELQKNQQDTQIKYQLEQQSQQNEELQNYLHEKGQKIQHEIEQIEANAKAQLQVQEANQFENIQKQKQPLSELQTVYRYPQTQQQFYPQFDYNEPQDLFPQQPQQESFINFPQEGLEKPQSQPDNYAQLYFYPSEEELNKYIPKAQHAQIKKQIQQKYLQQSNPISLSQKFQLIPYGYNPQAQLEAQALLENQWTALDQFNFRPQKIASQPLSQGRQQISTTKIIAEQYKDHAVHLQHAAHQLTADQFEAIRHHSEEVQELQKKAVEKLNELQKAAKEDEKRIIAQHKEAQRLDAELEHEEFKAEVAKAEEKFFGSLRQEQKFQFKHETPYLPSQPQLETGFKPLYAHKLNKEQLQYASKLNDENFAQELKESTQRNQLEKAKALAKAAAISNSPPVILHVKEVKVTRPIEVVKHVPVPQPFYVPVPAPFEVKVPQPYPVPLEIIRHVPIPIVKTEKIEIEKPVPVEVEKQVPVTVTKNVYIPVEKPYFVERVVPVAVKKEIVAEKVIVKPHKFTIVKHSYSHK